MDAIWINPWHPSPMADAGYDVSDYRAAQRLVERVRQIGMDTGGRADGRPGEWYLHPFAPVWCPGAVR